MKLKFICCEVFFRMACLAAAQSKNVISMEFTPLKSHENSKLLNGQISDMIEKSDNKKFDAIILGLGLCGNSAVGFGAKNTKIIIPKAHDCCTVFLGSRKKFKEHFSNNLSATWSSCGYLEAMEEDYLGGTGTGVMMGWNQEYNDLVEKYGEEDAKYVWDTLHPPNENKEIIYITTPEFEHLGFMEKIREKAENEEKELKVIDGDMSIIRKLVDGNWDDDFLVVPPGGKIKALYDMENIMGYE